MKTPSRWLAGAWVTYAIAWVLPVHESGVTLPRGLPGWEAFRIAASPVWPCHGGTFDSAWIAILATASAATNLVMLASAVAVVKRSRVWVRRTAWLALAAFVVDAFWCLVDLKEAADLRAGYFLWWWSFLPLWLGLSKLARELRQSASP